MRRLCSGLLLLLLIASWAAQTASATSFEAGHILVIRRDGSVSTTWALTEYTSTGTLIQKIAVPYPTGPYPATERPRGMALAPDGRLAIFNGTFDPSLSIFDPSGGAWTHSTHPEWDMANIGSDGDVAAVAGALFAPDMETFGGSASGVIRFDPASGSSARFGDAFEYRDISASLDGLLYAMRATGDSGNIDVYDPTTTDLLRTITLQSPDVFDEIRGFAVDAFGDIFGVHHSGTVNHYGPDGALLDSSQRLLTASQGAIYAELADIDIALDGTIVLGSRFGDVFVGDRSLDSFTGFSVGNDNTFVQLVPEPSTGLLVIAGLLGLAGWRRRRC